MLENFNTRTGVSLLTKCIRSNQAALDLARRAAWRTNRQIISPELVRWAVVTQGDERFSDVMLA